jgi:hypothetical protein
MMIEATAATVLLIILLLVGMLKELVDLSDEASFQFINIDTSVHRMASIVTAAEIVVGMVVEVTRALRAASTA